MSRSLRPTGPRIKGGSGKRAERRPRDSQGVREREGESQVRMTGRGPIPLNGTEQF